MGGFLEIQDIDLSFIYKIKPFVISYNNKEYSFKKSIAIKDFISLQNIDPIAKLIVGANINNKIVSLDQELTSSGKLEFVKLDSLNGIHIYRRSCLFLLLKAFHKFDPKIKVKVLYSLPNGPFCTVDGIRLTQVIVSTILQEMRSIVQSALPIECKIFHTEKCREILQQQNHKAKYKLFKYKQSGQSKLHYLDGLVGFFFGVLVPNTRYLSMFDLKMFKKGILLCLPNIGSPLKISKKPQVFGKFFSVLEEFQKWSNILRVETIGDLNESVENSTIKDLIKISEGLHEKKIAYIADKITRKVYKKNDIDRLKLILISGPSSSGKTTFSKRLDIQLRVNGIRTLAISLDNYYIDREKIPKNEQGLGDFESIDALNIELFNQNLRDLFAGKEVFLPKYDFNKGVSFLDASPTRLEKDQVVIVEGIHGLNDQLTLHIAAKKKFKIYVSALTNIRYDSTNLISTTDIRLLRRIVRDYRYRFYSAEQTIDRWYSVRIGEERNIFPYQENADIIFNSALTYEISVLKLYAVPLLRKVDQSSKTYAEVRRILKLISYFISISADEVPSTSLLREFIGDSGFSY